MTFQNPRAARGTYYPSLLNFEAIDKWTGGLVIRGRIFGIAIVGEVLGKTILLEITGSPICT